MCTSKSSMAFQKCRCTAHFAAHCYAMPQLAKGCLAPPTLLEPTAPHVQVLSLESFSAPHGFTVAASPAAAAGSSCELLLQPGQSELLLVTWQPVAPGAVRCVLHLLLGSETRLQVISP